MKKLKFILLTTALFLSVNAMSYTAQLDPSIPLESYTSIGEFNTDGNYDTWEFAEWGNRSVSEGHLNGTHIGGYPHMARVTSFTFENGSVIEVRMKFDTGTGHGYMRFLPRINGSENIYPGFSAETLTKQTDGNFHIYRFTLDAGDTNYFGNLTSVRFNPDDGGSEGDNFSIDYIRLSDSAPSVSTNIIPPYTDTQLTRALIHCDSVVTTLWSDGTADCLITPDDNSSIRPAVYPILNSTNVFYATPIVVDATTVPTFKTNSPYSGKYLSFDGNDSIIVTNSWTGGDSMFMDFAFRLQGLPNQSPDNWMALLTTYPVKAYIRNNGDDVYGKVTVIVYDADVAAHYVTVNKLLNSNVWYHLSLSISNNNVKVTVGSENSGYATQTTSIPSFLEPAITDVIIGNSYFVPSRSLKGDLDEIRWGIIVPEPTFLCLSIFSLLMFYRKIFYR